MDIKTNKMINKFWINNLHWNDLWISSIALIIIPILMDARIGEILFCFSIFIFITVAKIFNLGENK